MIKPVNFLFHFWRETHPVQFIPPLQSAYDITYFANLAYAWPRVSVVVCAYNAADTIEDCLAALVVIAAEEQVRRGHFGLLLHHVRRQLLGHLVVLLSVLLAVSCAIASQYGVKNLVDSLTAGSSLANAATVTVYLKSAADFAAMNEVYATYFPKDPPARTTVVLTQPLANADGLVEISMVAVPPTRRLSSG